MLADGRVMTPFPVISHKLLGTAEWFVIHHTDCGMTLFTDEIIRDLL
jgi:carbonic anhydrase